MLRRVWQASNCLSIHATYWVIVAGASPGETKMWAAVRENGDFFALAVRISAKLLKIDGYRTCCETFVIIEFSFHPHNIQRDCPRGVPRGNQNVVKIASFGLMHSLKHRITRKLLKIDR